MSWRLTVEGSMEEKRGDSKWFLVLKQRVRYGWRKERSSRCRRALWRRVGPDLSGPHLQGRQDLGLGVLGRRVGGAGPALVVERPSGSCVRLNRSSGSPGRGWARVWVGHQEA